MTHLIIKGYNKKYVILSVIIIAARAYNSEAT